MRRASVVGSGAAFATVITVQSAAVAQTWGAAYALPAGAAAAVVCVLALLRRRPGWAPFAGLAVAALAVLLPEAAGADLPTEPSPALALGLAVLVGAAVRTRPPVAAGAAATAWAVLVAAGQVVAGPEVSGLTGVTAINGLAWAAAVAAGLTFRTLDARAAAVAERVRRAERLELARELHDIVAHHITGMLIQAQAAQIVARRDPGRVGGALTEIEAAGSDALAAMRRVVGLLRDADDGAPPSPGPEELGTLVGRFEGKGPAVRLRVPDRTDWPPEVAGTVHRVVQESLTNVLRHAPRARSVEVTVDRVPEGIAVEVADDAPHGPAHARHRGGYGLVGMRERVESLGGTLSAGPGPGAGWSVRAVLPVPAGEPR
ncbi:sensor histidine kinase [Actinomadura namibiensis]|uniref:histidine kinase n=1 Tax=Actinomadura namibiensis TaxID=182080 RepID=A0A7W3M0I6_ACTNM|nr:histidine kinase [Actinomadura namibiensis]MBA8957637.1 signal transduction histidine kinase [Actinomadura namibiensis]